MKCNISKSNTINIPNGYVSTTEAASRTKCKGGTRKIGKLIETGSVRFKPNNGRNYVHYIDVIQYLANHPEKKTNTVWGEVDEMKQIAFFQIYGYDDKYFITADLTVYNASNGQVLTPQQQLIKDKKTGEYKPSGYLQVSLMCHGKSKMEFIHRLVAETQCPNSLRKNLLHHINTVDPNNPRLSDNLAKNLLWVWEWQHIELHRLLRENKIDEYKKLVRKIKKENSQKIYKIKHPDYMESDKLVYYMYITSEGYKTYKKTKDIPLNCIVMESAELKEAVNI